jgi:hypothetical protein
MATDYLMFGCVKYGDCIICIDIFLLFILDIPMIELIQTPVRSTLFGIA